MDEIPMGEVLVGTIFLNERPIIILFDFCASHDFKSSTCAKKARLTMVATEAPYVTSTLLTFLMQLHKRTKLLM
jgi:hypothetical protein